MLTLPKEKPLFKDSPNIGGSILFTIIVWLILGCVFLGAMLFAPYLWYGWQAELEEMKRHPNKNYFTLS